MAAIEPIAAEMRQVGLERREVGIGVAAHEEVHRRALAERAGDGLREAGPDETVGVEQHAGAREASQRVGEDHRLDAMAVFVGERRAQDV